MKAFKKTLAILIVLFSQAFFLSILIQQGFPSVFDSLAATMISLHPTESFQNMPAMAQVLSLEDRPFELVGRAFTWPAPGWGVLTGLGVLLATLFFGLADKILLMFGTLFLYLIFILSPVIFLLSVVLFFYLKAKPFFWSALGSLALCFLMFLSVKSTYSIYGTNAEIFLGIGKLIKTSGVYFQIAVFYANTVVYVIGTLLWELAQLKGLGRYLKSRRPPLRG